MGKWGRSGEPASRDALMVRGNETHLNHMKDCGREMERRTHEGEDEPREEEEPDCVGEFLGRGVSACVGVEDTAHHQVKQVQVSGDV